MNSRPEKTQENESQSMASAASRKQSHGNPTFQFVDNRPEAIAQRKLQEMANNNPQAKQAAQLQAMADNHSARQRPIQKKENNTGLPDNLKSGIENLSGYSMDDVKVHYNSDKPAQLQAHAYAQGSEIHVAQGQEQHLPHEAWHVVQQTQGRVKPTMQMKGGVAVNDDAGLESEADLMGAKALQGAVQMYQQGNRSAGPGRDVIQRVVYPNDGAMWAAVAPATPYGNIMGVINGNAELANLYQAVIAHLGIMDFVLAVGVEPSASYQQNPAGTYAINYDIPANQQGRFQQEESFVGAIIHEMGHVASSQLYNTQIPHGSTYHIANMHLPAINGATFPGTNVGMNQVQDPVAGATAQEATMDANWVILDNILAGSTDFSPDEQQFLQGRIHYGMGATPHAHYDTVLLDILFFLQHQHMTETWFYLQATAMLQEANNRRAPGVGVVQNVAAVNAPAQNTMTLHQCVNQLLNDPRWSAKGKAFIGHKTPAGIKHLRAIFQNQADQRNALAVVQNTATVIAQAASPYRIPVTQQAYNALRTDYRTAGLGPTILAVNTVIGML